MSALATIAIATAAIAGGEVAAAAGGSTPLVGASCAFGICAMGTFAMGAGPEDAEAAPVVFTTNSRRRIGRGTLRVPVARVGGTRL